MDFNGCERWTSDTPRSAHVMHVVWAPAIPAAGECCFSLASFSLTVQFQSVAHMHLPGCVVAAGRVELVMPILYLVFCSMLI